MTNLHTYTDDLRTIRQQAHTDVIKQIRATRKVIADSSLACGIALDAGIDHFNEIGHNVLSRVCSLDSPQVSVFNVKFGNNGKLDEHRHESTEVIYVLDGSIIDLNTGVTTVAGHTYRIPPGRLHTIRSDYALLVVTFKPALP
jgi:quercetin dioxygenase-like cupin family protein